MYKKVVFDNGVRVVVERMASLRSVSIGIWTQVGSRHEKRGEEGLSHFIEHMMFKGTRRRTASQISHDIDALGGEMNAFTTHETTTFYVKVLDQYLSPALDLLADLFHHSRFQTKEIEKEKQVVLEEIRAVKDDPEDFVHELHVRDILGSHPLGRSILGEPETMERIRRRDLLRYVKRHYHPHNTIIAVAGNFDLSRLLSDLQKYFGQWSSAHVANALTRNDGPEPWPSHTGHGTFLYPKTLEQVHVCLGFPGLPVNHPDRYAVNVLNAIVGGGVSSRLFQEVREKRGLAYTIYSHLSTFSDGGLFTIYAATREKEAEFVVEVVCRELEKLQKRGVSKAELERTKAQLKGNLMLGLEGTFGRMSKLAKDELFHNRYISLQEMLQGIDRVTSERISHLSQSLFAPNFMVITKLGPFSNGTFSSAQRKSVTI
ncbi:MAG: insulinase family protein [Nitrospirae bacterium]|nr:MAG: insulinase family protein [Nitrospirota bacterium]